MKKLQILIIIFLCNFVLNAQTKSKIERLESIVYKEALSINGIQPIRDSISYIYSDGKIGGGLEQNFSLNDCKKIQYNKTYNFNNGLFFNNGLLNLVITNSFFYDSFKNKCLLSGLINRDSSGILLTSKLFFLEYNFNENNIIKDSESVSYNYNTGRFENAKKNILSYNENGFIFSDTAYIKYLIDSPFEIYGTTIYHYSSSNFIDSIIFLNSQNKISEIKIYDNLNRLIDNITYNYNASTNDYQLNTRKTNFFENEFVYSFYEKFTTKLDTLSRGMYYKYYDLQKNISDSIIFKWDNTLKIWDSLDKFTKYRIGSKVSNERYYYNKTNKIWQKIQKIDSVFNTNNEIRIVETFGTKLISNIYEWKENSKIEFKYNEHNNLSRRIESNYNAINCNCYEEKYLAEYNWKTYFKLNNYIDETTFNSSIYPNPFSTKTTLVYESEYDAKTFLSVSNANGEIVDFRTFKSSKGLNNFEYENANLPLGNYFLKLNLKNKQKVFKVIKN